MAKADAMPLEEMEELLPTKPRISKVNPNKLVYLAIGVPKFGKTTFFCDCPETLLIAFERGFQFQQTPTVFIDSWYNPDFVPYEDEDGVIHMTMTQLKKTLMASDKYKFLVFDTADQAAKKCTDYYLKKNGWNHPNDGGDYGRGYDIVQNTPMRQLIGDLLATGRGLAFITHQDIKTTDFKKGKKSMKETTLPGGVYKFLHTQADIILHGSFGTKQKGKGYRDRIWQTQGDEETLAGNRVRDLKLPDKYIIDPERPWQQWADFFEDPTLADEAEAELAASVKFRKKEYDEEDAEETAPVVKKKKVSTVLKKKG